MEMTMAAWSGFGEPPELDPIVAHEPTEYGWRGLTARGEIFQVRSDNDQVPSNITVTQAGKVIGQREVTNHFKLNIDDYLSHYNRAIEQFKQNQFDQALADLGTVTAMAPTAAARFNRGLVLLSMGRWREGFEAYEARLELMTPPMCRGLSLKQWRGEPLQGKSLLLVHDAGFGDTIMLLRYVPQLLDMGIDVRLMMPPELERIAAQFAPVTQVAQGEYYCPMLSLLHLLDQTIESVPFEPYLTVERAWADKWRNRVSISKKKLGVAWSVGRSVEGDYPRAIDLGDLLHGNWHEHYEIHSLQVQGADEAAQFGVHTHEFEDFADCAALTSLMDEVITIDTAAAHVAGAIGHPNVTVLLGTWASWRWHGNPFYPHVKLQPILK